jgi:hypothetical protein
MLLKQVKSNCGIGTASDRLIALHNLILRIPDTRTAFNGHIYSPISK